MTNNDLVGIVRNLIRDNGTQQAFPDVVDNTLATPVIVANNSPELTQFVVASLAEFSRYRPLYKPYTLNLIAGTQLYQLPTDWIAPDMVSFNKAANPPRIIDLVQYQLPSVNIAGPLSQAQNLLQFTWYNDLQQVYLSVAPANASSITFSYYADHSSSTVPAQWVEASVLPACERALRAIAADQSVKLQKYRIGRYAIDVDNTKIAEHLTKLAEDWRERFRREVVLRPIAMVGEVASRGYW